MIIARLIFFIVFCNYKNSQSITVQLT